MRHLIVNGDDFGASHGINLGILEAQRNGILTSASLFVDRRWSEEAAALARETPRLGVGLHADLDGPLPHGVRPELLRQLARFEELMGAAPTHLDSHHNVHRSPDVRPDFLAAAQERALLVRDFSRVRYMSEFYGQRGGRTDLEQVGVANLVRILKSRLHEGITELGCHPGYFDFDLVSGYTGEREFELRTLCDPALREVIREAEIDLVSFRDVPRILRELAIPV